MILLFLGDRGNGVTVCSSLLRTALYILRTKNWTVTITSFARNVLLTGLKVQEENTDGIQPKITLLNLKDYNLATTVTPGIQQTTTG